MRVFSSIAFPLLLIAVFASHVFAQECELEPQNIFVPGFPAIAVSMGDQGKVKAHLSVDNDGKVLSTTLETKTRWFAAVVKNATQKWTFKRVDPDCDSPSKVTVVFNFVLLPEGARYRDSQKWRITGRPLTVKVLGLPNSAYEFKVLKARTSNRRPKKSRGRM